MCHVAVRPTPAGTSPGVVGTHPPTHPSFAHPQVSQAFREVPWLLWEVPRVYWEVPWVLLEVPGHFGKLRSVLESSPGVLKIAKHTTNKSRFGIKHFRIKAKLLNFRTIFHSEPVVFRRANL
jgi:hypothetical protein